MILERQDQVRRPAFAFLSAIILAGSAFSQQAPPDAPKVGIIEIYGARRTSIAEIRKTIGLTEGAQLSGSKSDIEERVEALEGVLAARLEAACCTDGKVILYVGLQEKGAPTFEYHSPPAGEVRVPVEVYDTYTKFLQAVRAVDPSTNPAEDLTRGHSLMNDPAVREIQESFVPLANTHLANLRAVIRESDDPEHRAIAVYVIAYADDKPGIVNDVQWAIQDIDDTVRSNAIRALAGLSVLARKDPKSGVKISPTWLVEMLNSVTWTDRHNASIALVTLTEPRDPGTLVMLRERAMASLTEMARWKHLAHALPPYILLGRAAGVPEKELQDAWSKEQRESIIKRAGASEKR
jgi:hypothetical protein